MTSESDVGVIGAGAMGFALIKRLLVHFDVSMFDPSPAARERASAAGAVCLDGATEVFALGVPVIICVASPAALSSTVDAAVSAHERGAQLGPVIESSTLDLSLKEEARVRLAAAGTELLDCPVSGTSAQALNGDLVIFASGHPAARAACEPIFAAIARRTIQAGGFGMGMRLKLLANHLVGLHSAVAGEVLMLARKSGLDDEIVLEALTSSAGTSRMLEVRGPLMIKGAYLPAAGSIDIIVKDGNMIRTMARDAGCSLALYDRADGIYRSAQAEGLGSHDIASIHGYLLSAMDTRANPDTGL